MRRIELVANATRLLQRVSGALLMLAAVPLIGLAIPLMPLGKDNPEPQLIGAQVMFLATPATILWASGVLVLNKAARHKGPRWWILALAPLVVLVAFAVPTLVNVCSRPGGACG